MANPTTIAQAPEAQAWKPNATFPRRPAAAYMLGGMDAMLNFGMEIRKTVHFYADHGIGKTSKAMQFFRDRGLRICYINLANITPDDKVLVAPVTTENDTLALRQLLMDDLTPGEDFAIILDDARQADRKVQNQFMQLANDWTLGHQELPGLKAVVMLDNEGANEGIRTSEDPAVADRKFTVRLKPNDTGWRYALAEKYADVDLTRVFELWDSLDSELRHLLSPRCLDHVLYCTINGLPPIYGLPIIGDSRVRLVHTTSTGSQSDRTREILEKIALYLGQPYQTETTDSARKAIRLSMRDRLAILAQGDPGIGKTAIAKELIAEAGLREVYYSMPLTDPETLVVPIPKNGVLQTLVAEELVQSSPYAIIWDEYNRPSSKAAFAKLMEITQQWSIAGVPLDNCRAQIALCNPSSFMGHSMNVTKGNIAQADRFTISIQLKADDIPANEWLLTKWPDTVSNGDPDTRERARSTIESVIEWHKNDIGDEHRQWITKRSLERLALLHLHGLPLDYGKIYLGESEYAPVPLIDLEARLAERPMARLKEIAENLPMWEERLKVARADATASTNDDDQVHQALTLAELSQLKEHYRAVVSLVGLLPPKMRITFFAGAAEELQKFWVAIFAVVGKNAKLEDLSFD